MKNYYFLDGYVYHSRQETAQNSFKYPIINVVFDVSQEHNFLQELKNKFKGILTFSATTYLHNQELDIESSIRIFLKENFSYNPDQIFLQTIPKMFGYVFNPVSFWYCYKENMLTAVLCEVANTFGEKHYYWLYQSDNDINHQWLTAQKEFHVSPFFAIEGYYKFRFIKESSTIHVDIQFMNPDHTLKLNTWVSGTLKSIKDVSIGYILLKFGWFTPLVVFKIHFQAIRLFFKKVKFYTKPSPPKQEITRESPIISH